MRKIAVCVLIVDVESCTFLSVSLKNDHSDFNLPGGKVEIGEHLISTGIREVKEETGINVYNLKFLHEGYDENCQVFTYFTTNYDGNIYTKENHIVKWMPLYDLTKSKKWPEYNGIIYDKFLELNVKN
jgi:8-oxo-dGTP pyrophosphatase MutT (NUDIX family)